MRGELRTREANGAGTDVRLVLLEASAVADCLEQLDGWLHRLSGNGNGFDAPLDGDDPICVELAVEWDGLDLQEVTMRMRDVEDVLGLLLYGVQR